jgi:hypothetical protein
LDGPRKGLSERALASVPSCRRLLQTTPSTVPLECVAGAGPWSCRRGPFLRPSLYSSDVRLYWGPRYGGTRPLRGSGSAGSAFSGLRVCVCRVFRNKARPCEFSLVFRTVSKTVCTDRLESRLEGPLSKTEDSLSKTFLEGPSGGAVETTV